MAYLELSRRFSPRTKGIRHMRIPTWTLSTINPGLSDPMTPTSERQYDGPLELSSLAPELAGRFGLLQAVQPIRKMIHSNLNSDGKSNQQSFGRMAKRALRPLLEKDQD